jgi:hypothetical protein
MVIAGEQTFFVHTCILAVRAPVFKLMLKSGMSEAKDRELVVEDDPGVFREFLT